MSAAQDTYFKGPIGYELESFLGDTRADLTFRARAVRNWEGWLEVALGPQQEKFTARLSLAQFNSHRILLELWTGPPADKQLLVEWTNYYRDETAERAGHGIPLPIETGLSLPLLDDTASAFENAVFALFAFEFFFTAGQHDGSARVLSMLHSTREEAAVFMSCARLSRQCIPQLVSEPYMLQKSHKSPVIQSSGLRLNCSSWKKDSATTGAAIEPCPWLKSKPKQESLPYYLWDRQLNCTIIVSQLQSRPEYFAISHTWGRWKIEGPPVKLSGTPWSIPANTRFDVHNLPTILRECTAIPYRYVWMDLVCIPQDGSKLSKIEISRQATIFREAANAVMWLNDIEEWRYLPAVVEWLCLEFISQNKFLRGDLVEPLDNHAMQDRLSGDVEFMTPKSQKVGVPGPEEINPWFTSLWTLQEVCLRPDMLIADKHLRLLSPGNAVITFDNLVALNYAQWKADKVAKIGSVRQLSSLLGTTGLSELPSMTLTTILGLGSRRYCSEGRAEAIMSVLDATEWFSSCADNAEREKDLVMKQYPQSFVQEIRKKLGSSTFFSSARIRPYFPEVLAQYAGETDNVSIGSMLPFGSRMPIFYFNLGFESGVIPHPSIETWMIESTGAVRVENVVIISSSMEESSGELLSAIYAPVVGESTGMVELQEHVDLHVWVKAYEPSHANYAVSLFASSIGSIGVLLKELTPNVLVKVGIYYLNASRNWALPDTRHVKWLII